MPQLSNFDRIDANVRLLASLAAARQFSARTFVKAQQISASIKSERASVNFYQESRPQSNKAAWNVTWAGGVFHNVVYDGSPHTQIESVHFSALWDSRISKTSSRALVDYGRRKLPIFFDEWHIRQRMRQRLPETTKSPAQQFLNLGHMVVSYLGILFLECAERNLAFKTYPATIAIPVEQGLVLGEIRQNSPFEKPQPPAMSLSVTQGGRIALSEPSNYNYHLRIGTFIDYETLNYTKEDVSRQLRKLFDKDTTAVLGTRYLDDYLGLTTQAFIKAIDHVNPDKLPPSPDLNYASFLKTYQSMGGSEGLGKAMQELGALAEEALSRLKARAPNEAFPNGIKADTLKP